jgi:hypothetical protein
MCDVESYCCSRAHGVVVVAIAYGTHFSARQTTRHTRKNKPVVLFVDVVQVQVQVRMQMQIQ